MKINRIVVAAVCGAALAIAGACAGGATNLTSPVTRAPNVSATVVDTFCCGITQQKAQKASTTTAVDTFPK